MSLLNKELEEETVVAWLDNAARIQRLRNKLATGDTDLYILSDDYFQLSGDTYDFIARNVNVDTVWEPWMPCRYDADGKPTDVTFFGKFQYKGATFEVVRDFSLSHPYWRREYEAYQSANQQASVDNNDNTSTSSSSSL